jgi:hypothetical protein
VEQEEYIERFKEVAYFFGFRKDEYRAFKILCVGNRDAAKQFVGLISERIRADPRFGINEKIEARISAESKDVKSQGESHGK